MWPLFPAQPGAHCMKCLSSCCVPHRLPCRGFGVIFSTQVKKKKNTGKGEGWVDEGSSPAGEGSAGLELSLRVLSLKFCCKHLCSPPGAMCVLCVCSPLALLLPCCWSSPTGGKGALPPPVEHLSVLVCVGSWRVADVAGRKKGDCQPAPEKSAASGKDRGA